MKQDVRQIALEARAWISSEEGRKQIEALLRRAKEVRMRSAKARRIPPQRLHQPMTAGRHYNEDTL